MAGFEVNRGLLDMKAADAVISVREAFEKVDTINSWLATVPSDAPGGDLLTIPIDNGGKFGYTADEAYLIRLVMQNLASLTVQTVIDQARPLTGLQ